MGENFEKPSRTEEEFFAREDIERLRKMAFQQKAQLAAQDQEALRKLHHNRCPSCGLDLHSVKHGAVDVDTCFHCKSIWLKQADLEKLMHEHKHPIVQTFINLFKRELAP